MIDRIRFIKPAYMGITLIEREARQHARLVRMANAFPDEGVTVTDITRVLLEVKRLNEQIREEESHSNQTNT